jgi:phosphoribosylamine--glycine ligase
LPLLKTDIVDIIEAVWEENLEGLSINWSENSASCVVMASGGYPEKYQTGLEITGLDNSGQTENSIVYHAGTKFENGKFLTAGGRVLGVTATALTLKESLNKAYDAVNSINFQNAHYRKDIGEKALKVS